MSAEQIIELGTATVKIRLRNISSRFMILEEQESLAEASRMIFRDVIVRVDIEIIAVESENITGYYNIGIISRFADSDSLFTMSIFTGNLQRSLVSSMGSAVSFIMDIGQLVAGSAESEFSGDSSFGLTEENIVKPPCGHAN